MKIKRASDDLVVVQFHDNELGGKHSTFTVEMDYHDDYKPIEFRAAVAVIKGAVKFFEREVSRLIRVFAEGQLHLLPEVYDEHDTLPKGFLESQEAIRSAIAVLDANRVADMLNIKDKRKGVNIKTTGYGKDFILTVVCNRYPEGIRVGRVYNADGTKNFLRYFKAHLMLKGVSWQEV